MAGAVIPYPAPQPTPFPSGGVRHAYPLAVRDGSFGTAVGLMLKTLPYAVARFGVLVAVSVVTIIWCVVAFGGWALLAAKIHPGVGLVWFVLCCAVLGYFWFLVVRYFLYLLKCGHIVVLTDLVTRGHIDHAGKGMFAYGKDVVRARFGEVTALFAVGTLVKAVVRTFNRTLDFIASLLPLPGLSSLMSFVNAVVYAATTYIDETIFSYGLARQETNPWASAKDGIVYYAQNSKELLKTGIYIVILDKVLSVLVWVVMLAPAFLIAALIPRSMSGAGFWIVFGIAVLLASNVRSAFLKPLFLVMIMTKFHVLIENQPINAEWEAQVGRVSDKFRQIVDKAIGQTPGRMEPPAVV